LDTRSTEIIQTVAGRPNGFGSILGITVDHVDHLEGEIRIGIRRTPITSVTLSPMGSGAWWSSRFEEWGTSKQGR
jgi:hypothetical protein